MNSRQKGARGERELANILKERGYEARRGQQYCGSNGDADVVGVKGLHIECKRVERLDINKAMEQSINDARPEEIPCVMHRKDRDYWKTTLGLDDFLDVWECSNKWKELMGNATEEEKEILRRHNSKR